MSLAETVTDSEWQMNEADKAEFVERALVDGEKIVAAFELEKRLLYHHSIVFTNKRLVLETQKATPDKNLDIKPVSRRLMSIPYRNISLHTVELDLTSDPDGKTGVLRLWVSGYYNETGSDAERRWIDIAGDGKLDLYMLSGILSSQMAM